MIEQISCTGRKVSCLAVSLVQRDSLPRKEISASKQSNFIHCIWTKSNTRIRSKWHLFRIILVRTRFQDSLNGSHDDGVKKKK